MAAEATELTALSRMVAFGLRWCAIAVALPGSSRPISGWTMWRFSGSWSHTSRSLRRHPCGRIWSIGRRSSPVDGSGWAPDQARVDRLGFYVGCVVRRALCPVSGARTRRGPDPPTVIAEIWRIVGSCREVESSFLSPERARGRDRARHETHAQRVFQATRNHKWHVCRAGPNRNE